MFKKGQMVSASGKYFGEVVTTDKMFGELGVCVNIDGVGQVWLIASEHVWIIGGAK